MHVVCPGIGAGQVPNSLCGVRPGRKKNSNIPERFMVTVIPGTLKCQMVRKIIIAYFHGVLVNSYPLSKVSKYRSMKSRRFSAFFSDICLLGETRGMVHRNELPLAVKCKGRIVNDCSAAGDVRPEPVAHRVVSTLILLDVAPLNGLPVAKIKPVAGEPSLNLCN